MNTLKENSPQQHQLRLTRSQHFSQLPPNTDPSKRSKTQPQATSTLRGHGVDRPPAKRRKLDSPVRDDLHNGIGLDSGLAVSQGAVNSRSKGRHNIQSSDLAASYGFEEPNPPASRLNTNGVKHTPLRGLAVVGRQPHQATSRNARGISPDHLMDDESSFMKNATRQRKAGHFDSDDDQALSGTSSRDVSGLYEQRHKRSPSTPITPLASKVAEGYDKMSPDELSSSTASTTRQGRRGILLSPTDHSTPPGQRFTLRNFVCHGFIAVPAYEVEVFPSTKSFVVHYRAAEIVKDALTPVIPLSKISHLVIPETEETNCIMLRLRAPCLLQNKCFLEFESPKALSEFCHLVCNHESTISITNRSR